MLRLPRYFSTTNIAALSKAAAVTSATTLNPSTTPAPGTTSSIAVTGSNLIASGPSSSYGRACSIGAANSGLIHMEFTIGTKANATTISLGVCNASKDQGPGAQSWAGGTDNIAGVRNSVAVYDDCVVWKNDGSNSGGTETGKLEFVAGDVITVEIDVSNGLIYFMRNNDAYRSGSYAAPTGLLYAYIGLDNPNTSVSCNFGGSAWFRTPTSGYTGLLS